MSVLLQISDAHFGTEHSPVVEALRALALEHSPDVVVWTGDLTQRARPGQFAAARRFAESLPGRHITMPGNHDIPLYNVLERLVRPYARYRREFGHELEPEIDTDDLLLLMLNTTRRWRHKHGQLSIAQAARIEERLRRARPSQLRVIATHQPVHALTAEDEHHRLRGARDVLARWARAGADLVLAGHTHRPGCHRVAQGHRPVWLVQAGTSLSTRLRAGQPNSVNLVHHDRRDAQHHCRVERWDYDAGARCFARATGTDIVLAR